MRRWRMCFSRRMNISGMRTRMMRIGCRWVRGGFFGVGFSMVWRLGFWSAGGASCAIECVRGFMLLVLVIGIRMAFGLWM